LGAGFAEGGAPTLDAVAAVNLGVLLVGLLVVVGVISSLIAARVGAPLLLIFLLIGMLAGEDGLGGFAFDDYRTTYLVGSLALAIVLFDGGLRMRFARLRGSIGPAAVLATLGVLVTAGVVGLAAIPLLGLSVPEGLLVGAIVSSTDAAAVLFLLGAGGLQLRRRVGATLEVEAGVNDPAAVLLTVLLIQIVIAAGAPAEIGIAQFLLAQLAIGVVIGAVGGFALVAALNRLELPAGLPPLFVVAGAVTIYGAATVAGGSGFLAVYLAGLIVGNRPIRGHAAILRFHDAATWLAQMVMFLVLGLLVTPSRLVEHLLPAVAIAAVLVLVARPVAVWLGLAPFGFNWREKTFVSWVGLRGAVSIFLAAIPVLSNVPGASMYFDVAFVVVLVSLTLQGWTVASAARWTGVARGDTAPSVNRVEIDLPGRLDLEMVGYPVQPDSYVLARGRLPRWLRLLLVVRNGEVLAAADAAELEADDFAYFLAPRNRLRLLDRMFAPVDLIEHARGDGLFSFRGGVRLDEVAALYGAKAPDELAGRTIAEAFVLRWDSTAEVGDRIDLGDAALVAAVVTDEGVSLAWLDLEPRRGSATGVLAIAAVRRLLEAGRRLWRRVARRSKSSGAVKTTPASEPAPKSPATDIPTALHETPAPRPATGDDSPEAA
jgi:cell volume regulation protein A